MRGQIVPRILGTTGTTLLTFNGDDAYLFTNRCLQSFSGAAVLHTDLQHITAVDYRRRPRIGKITVAALMQRQSRCLYRYLDWAVGGEYLKLLAINIGDQIAEMIDGDDFPAYTVVAAEGNSW